MSAEGHTFVNHSSGELVAATEVAQQCTARRSLNGVSYAMFGDTHITEPDLERVVQAVPASIAHALEERVYYFVPLTIGDQEETMVATTYTVDLGDRAICHRNVSCGPLQCIFISTRLMQDRFALAFELFINVGHHFVEAAGVPESFSNLVWSQAVADVRGETSQDAWESRRRAIDRSKSDGHVDGKAKNSFFESAFSDAVAIYMLALTLDFDYADLREREYPLLAAPLLAERLRHVAGLFPANPGYEFEVKYRKRT
ncbi:MAG TPA: hypothetical protein VGD59_06800 [Acidisarcina sp.]